VKEPSSAETGNPDPTTAMRLFSMAIVAMSGVFLTGREGL
jgi:hypothetical protein